MFSSLSWIPLSLSLTDSFSPGLGIILSLAAFVWVSLSFCALWLKSGLPLFPFSWFSRCFSLSHSQHFFLISPPLTCPEFLSLLSLFSASLHIYFVISWACFPFFQVCVFYFSGSFSHSCSSLSYSLLFFSIPLPSEGCCPAQMLAVSALRLGTAAVLFPPGRNHGHRLMWATHRHLEARFGATP